MSKRSVHTNKRLIARIAGTVFAILGIAFAVTGLMAPRPTPTPSATPSSQCKNWPPCNPGNCDDVRDRVKKVFTGLIDEASKGPQSQAFRDKLTDKQNGYNNARLEVRGRLSPIPFGDEHTVIFYVSENPTGNFGMPGTMQDYPNNHCVHVFYLPDMPTAAQPTPTPAVFESQLMCCYQPWVSEKQTSPTPHP